MSSRPVGRLLDLEYRILELAIDAAGDSEDGTVYGFQLARDLSDSSAASLIGHGTLYKALSRLSTMGFLEWQWESDQAASDQGRPRRRLYRITGAGEAAVRARSRAERITIARAATA